MKIKDGFMLRNIAGDYFVVPVGQATEYFNGMITLNKVSAFMWEHLSKGTTQDEILSAVLEKYDVSEERARCDIDAFISKVREAGILEE